MKRTLKKPTKKQVKAFLKALKGAKIPEPFYKPPKNDGFIHCPTCNQMSPCPIHDRRFGP